MVGGTEMNVLFLDKNKTKFNYRKIIINTLLERDGEHCRICGKPFTDFAPAELDHIIPRSKGGPDILSNLQLVHSICNRRKMAKDWKDINTLDTFKKLTFEEKLPFEKTSFEKWFDNLKTNFILSEFQKNSRNLTKTAKALGMTRRRLTYFLKKNKLI